MVKNRYKKMQMDYLTTPFYLWIKFSYKISSYISYYGNYFLLQYEHWIVQPKNIKDALIMCN